MVYTLPCGINNTNHKRNGSNYRQVLLEHMAETNCPICTQFYLAGERRKREYYTHEYSPPPSCPINPQELCVS